jgi:hypothetical protein
MTYLICKRCGFSLLSRNPLIDPEYCPRCVARARVAQQLVRSPAPAQRIGDAAGSGGRAGGPQIRRGDWRSLR